MKNPRIGKSAFLPPPPCFLLMLFLLSASLGCGGGGGGSAATAAGGSESAAAPAPAEPAAPAVPQQAPTPTYTAEFLPSSNFSQVCADPAQAYDQAAARQGTSVDENNWLRSFTHETYLWYDEVADRDPACCSTPEYYSLMRTPGKTASGNPKDRFSWSTNTRRWADSQRGVRFGFGVRIAELSGGGVVILDVEPTSAAGRAGLRRGMVISRIDGRQILTLDDLSEALSGSQSRPQRHEFTVLVPGESGPRSAVMTSAEIVQTPVRWTVLTNSVSGRKVGYMLFNTHIPPAEPLLAAAVRDFVRESVDDLVLDLRYNGGGRLAIASRLAFMAAGPGATENKVFEESITNGKFPSGPPLPFLRYGADSAALPSLDLKRVFVLTTPGTCSASEAVINGLRGIDVEVVLIGGTTCGKPFGFIPRDNCGTTYFLIQFQGVNDKGFGSFEDGFRPTCSAQDDPTRQLGDPREGMLGTALAYMTGGGCPASGEEDGRRALKASSAGDSSESSGIVEVWPPLEPLRITGGP